ncbi:MAG: 2-hydroxychromene-2-carboxylate isomerase [Gammaproteobacteria bacterium]|nr:2-hydroxychromene-2-carboxylate isomerase [Gammaproteobacteria bacterium]
MAAPIDFYFDFSSPYGYFASCRIEELAARHGREVLWRPYLMGVVMKTTGALPLVDRPLIRDYAAHDIPRTARLYGIPFTMPKPFPVATVGACRAFYWVADRDPGQARDLAHALYSAYFAHGRNIGDNAVVADVAAELGHERGALEAGMNDPAIKERLRQETDGAIGRGVFGSPFVIVDGEAFWGSDRLDQVARWLETGGW